MKESVSRRVFLERVGAGAALTGLLSRGASAVDWSPPPVLANPNILLIMVDQMRFPVWLNATQTNALNQQYLPNIFGRLRNRAYNFQQYYVAATVCTASRATLLTGLYAPQTAMYVGDSQWGTAPALNPGFPTWATALPALNPAYTDNCWWFGKWHLSTCTGSDPLRVYRFRTRTYPGGAAGNPSPDGAPNEGVNGGPFGGRVFANDAQIAGDFVAWLQERGAAGHPWCATVSFVNPHDIACAPAWLHNPYPPQGVPIKPVYFPPPDFGPAAGGPAALYSAAPSPWNYEDLAVVTGKPGLQLAYRDWAAKQVGQVGKLDNWAVFLNWYYWLHHYVDRQVGAILDALEASGQAGNTAVLFTADHGDYAGSHGLHGKGFAAYDESLRVPFYVTFPGQTGSITMQQMCSSVDVFGLICDLGTSGIGGWRQGSRAYPDLARRQSLWSFLYGNAPETRVAPTLGLPYIFHTYDGGSLNGQNGHIVCLRTKTSGNNQVQPGAKLAVYSGWDACRTVPNNVRPEYEFYDYNPHTTNNQAELGNDYYSSNAATQATIAQYLGALGSWGPPGSGLIATELNPPLTGAGTDGKPLSQAQAAARQSYFAAVSGPSKCTA